MFTFFAVFSFVSGVASTRAHDTNPTTPALRVDTLRRGHVALGALPAAETEAAALGVLAVAATQHRTGCCEIEHDRGITSHVSPKIRSQQQHVGRTSAMPFLPPNPPPPFLSREFAERLEFLPSLFILAEKKSLSRIPLEQSGPRNPGKQWQVPETHSPFPWQFLGHSSTDSEEEKKKRSSLSSLPPVEVNRATLITVATS